jgi:hypothetical protein
MPLTSIAGSSIDTLLAVAVAGMAMAGSFGALIEARHTQQVVAEIEVQTVVSEAYQSRALSCLDHAQSLLDNAEHRRQAEMSLALSKGITFCLVRARDEARLEVSALTACTREVEAANTVFEVNPDGSSELRPVC